MSAKCFNLLTLKKTIKKHVCSLKLDYNFTVLPYGWNW